MTIKLLEIRDRMTCIAALAIHLRNRTPKEFFLLRRAGYSAEQIGGRAEDVEPYILLMSCEGGRCGYDPYAWGDRTFRTAHLYLIDCWDKIASGDVVDIEYILGETTQTKVSEIQS